MVLCWAYVEGFRNIDDEVATKSDISKLDFKVNFLISLNSAVLIAFIISLVIDKAI